MSFLQLGFQQVLKTVRNLHSHSALTAALSQCHSSALPGLKSCTLTVHVETLSQCLQFCSLTLSQCQTAWDRPRPWQWSGGCNAWELQRTVHKLDNCPWNCWNVTISPYVPVASKTKKNMDVVRAWVDCMNILLLSTVGYICIKTYDLSARPAPPLQMSATKC